MASFIGRFFPRGRDDQGYESLPLTHSGVPAVEETKDDEPTVVSRFKWLPAATPNPGWFWALVPFIIARPLGKTERTLPRTTSTTYLNGIRGLACWVVFNHHMSMEIYRPLVFKTYGAPEAHENRWLFQLPILRIVYCGKGMVCLFFALSGFVLSYSSLRKINGGQPEKMADDLLTGLSSALLRRGIRLFTPMFVLALVTGLMTYYMPWGVMDHEATNILAHLVKYYRSCVMVMNPYAWEMNRMPRHFPHAWTLAQEYRLSLALFLVLIATCKLRPLARKLLIATIGVWSLYCDRRWDVLGFMGGFLVAELRFAPLSQDLAQLFRRPNFKVNRWVSMVAGGIAVSIGMLFCSWPEHEESKRTAPYGYFWKLAPVSWRGETDTELSASYIWYFGSVGSVLILWGMEQLPLLQRLLSCTALNYLGEISYAFYLVHWIFKIYVGIPLFHYFTEQLKWPKTPSFVLEYSITLVLVTMAGDYFWRAVDEKCVKLARFVVTDVLGVGTKSEKRPDPLSTMPMRQVAERFEERIEEMIEERIEERAVERTTITEREPIPVFRLD